MSLENDDVDELTELEVIIDEIDEMLLKHQIDIQIAFELDEVVEEEPLETLEADDFVVDDDDDDDEHKLELAQVWVAIFVWLLDVLEIDWIDEIDDVDDMIITTHPILHFDDDEVDDDDIILENDEKVEIHFEFLVDLQQLVLLNVIKLIIEK